MHIYQIWRNDLIDFPFTYPSFEASSILPLLRRYGWRDVDIIQDGRYLVSVKHGVQGGWCIYHADRTANVISLDEWREAKRGGASERACYR